MSDLRDRLLAQAGLMQSGQMTRWRVDMALMFEAADRIAELEAARDFGIVDGDAVAHLNIVSLQAAIAKLHQSWIHRDLTQDDFNAALEQTEGETE